MILVQKLPTVLANSHPTQPGATQFAGPKIGVGEGLVLGSGG